MHQVYLHCHLASANRGIRPSMCAQEIVTFQRGRTKGQGAPAHVTDTMGGHIIFFFFLVTLWNARQSIIISTKNEMNRRKKKTNRKRRNTIAGRGGKRYKRRQNAINKIHGTKLKMKKLKWEGVWDIRVLDAGPSGIRVCVRESMWLPHKFLPSLCAHRTHYVRRCVYLCEFRMCLWASASVSVSVSVGRSCLRRSFVNEHTTHREQARYRCEDHPGPMGRQQSLQHLMSMNKWHRRPWSKRDGQRSS